MIAEHRFEVELHRATRESKYLLANNGSRRHLSAHAPTHSIPSKKPEEHNANNRNEHKRKYPSDSARGLLLANEYERDEAKCENAERGRNACNERMDVQEVVHLVRQDRRVERNAQRPHGVVKLGAPMTSNAPAFHGTASYLTSEALESAVNCALTLSRPLLVKGEPGTGKTLLAEAIAEALRMPLLRWHVKSTTRAQDGLYVYDTVQRLYDSRFGDGDVKDIRRYIRMGPLGEAFTAPKRVVLLIDEVDKADIEFPNDLLHELDRMRFSITELNEEVVAKERPVVIITSNNEKELPDAFLRRCVFHFIDFPDATLMKRILDVHHPDLDAKLAEQALKTFYELREMKRLRKRPSTSELVDWIAVLKSAGIKGVKLDSTLPFLGALIKKEQDMVALADELSGGKKYRT